MKKLVDFCKDKFGTITVLFMVVIIMVNMNQCSTNKKWQKQNFRLVNENARLIKALDSIHKLIPTEEILSLKYEKQMYEFLKLSLYDWNSIVRTKERPDDKIREYDDMIKRIQEKIKKN
jgi:hypothetical protein